MAYSNYYQQAPDQYGNDVPEYHSQTNELEALGDSSKSAKRKWLEAILGMVGAGFGGYYLSGLNALGGATSAATHAATTSSIPAWSAINTTPTIFGGSVGGGLGAAGGAGTAGSAAAAAAAKAAAVKAAASGAGKASFMNALRSPEGMSSLVSGGLGVGSALLAKSSANDQRDWEYGSGLAAADADEQLNQLRRQQSYFDTFKENPLGQQEQMFKTAARNKFAQHGPIQLVPGGISNPINFNDVSQQYMNDDALAQAAARFYAAAGSLDPNQTPPNLQTTGLTKGNNYQTGLNDAVSGALERMQALSRQRRQDLLNGIRSDSTRQRFSNQNSQDYFSRLT